MYNGYVASQYVKLAKKNGLEWLVTLYKRELKNKGFNDYTRFLNQMALNQITLALKEVGVSLC